MNPFVQALEISYTGKTVRVYFFCTRHIYKTLTWAYLAYSDKWTEKLQLTVNRTWLEMDLMFYVHTVLILMETDGRV